jgi:O-antigen/teichoic acid export membrane protein
MLDKLARLFKNSAIYTLGSVLTRAASLISMPVLTRYLAPEEYGILPVVASVMGSLQFVYIMGLRASSTRQYYDHDSEPERKIYFSSLLFFYTGLAALLSLVLMFFGARLLAPLLTRAVPFYPYIAVALGSLFLQVLGVLPNTLMRVREKAKLYIAVDVVRTMLATALSLLFVVAGGMGALGPLLASLLTSSISAAYLLYYLRPYLGFNFRWAPVRDSLSFGIPTMSERVCSWVLVGSDRLFLLHYVSLAATGIYSVSHSVGIMLQVIGGSLNFAWSPFFYATAREEDDSEARRLIASAATYFTLAIVCCALALAAFAREVFLILAPARYLAGLPLVPWLVFGSIFEALYDIPSRGLYLMKRTGVLPLIMLAAATASAALNFALIPRWGMMGAAWAGVLGYAVRLLLTLRAAQRVYAVPYEYGRIGKIFAAAGMVYFASVRLSPETFISGLVVKAAVLAVFPLVLYATGFFSAAELHRAREAAIAMWRKKRFTIGE